MMMVLALVMVMIMVMGMIRVIVLVMAVIMVMVLVMVTYGDDDGIDDVGGFGHNDGNGGVIVMVLSMVMITVMEMVLAMILATVMMLTRKIFAITVVMVVNIPIISKGDTYDCLFTRTDYTEETCQNSHAN